MISKLVALVFYGSIWLIAGQVGFNICAVVFNDVGEIFGIALGLIIAAVWFFSAFCIYDDIVGVK